jgi:hypothetical protein
METEAELRAEIARLREDVDHLLKLLGEIGYRTASPPNRKLWLEVDHVQLRPPESEQVPIEITCSEEVSGIYLYDRTGRCRGSFVVGQGGAKFELRNAEGKVVASLGEPGGHGQIYVASADGTPRATMRASELGGLVGALQPSGDQAAYLLAQKEGGKIEIVNANAASAVSLYADEEGCGVVRVHESSGEMMATLAANAETGVLAVCGPLGEMAATLASEASGGLLLLSDEHGNAKLSIPPPTDE